MSRSTRRTAGVTLAMTGVLLGSCADGERVAVEQAASEFTEALAAGEIQHACEMLAPSTRSRLESQEDQACAEAMQQIPLPGGPIEQADVWGGEAQVRTNGDTLFLTRTSQGWRIAAAGCRARGEAPYDCQLEGP